MHQTEAEIKYEVAEAPNGDQPQRLKDQVNDK